MGEDFFDWTSFWDLASPEQAARTLAGLYGPDAARAAADCALAAADDDRDEDYRFWLAVFARLRAAEQRPATGRPAPAPN